MKIIRSKRAEISIWLIIAIITSTFLFSCKKETRYNAESFFHGPPVITVFLVPLDGISEKDIEKAKNDFSELFAEKQWEPYIVTTLPHLSPTDTCLNDAKTRYRARKLISLLDTQYKETAKKLARKNNPEAWAFHIVGVTNKDISTTIHGHDDYGIFGLSYLSGNRASIVSTHRLKRRQDLWKLIAHEFCHGFYGAPHCPNNDPHCLMADAKGGNPHFEIKDSLCLDCANRCLIGD